MLGAALSGCGAPPPVIKRLGIDFAMECRQMANGLRLPVHMKRMKAGVKGTKVILKHRRHPGAFSIFHSGAKAGCPLRV